MENEVKSTSNVFDDLNSSRLELYPTDDGQIELDTPRSLTRSTRCRCSPRTLGGLIALGLVLGAWQSMAMLVQDLSDDLGRVVETLPNGTTVVTNSGPKPFFLVWTLHCGYVVFLLTALPIYELCLLARGAPLYRPSVRVMARAVVLNGVLVCADYLWYASLSYTAIAANSAVYNSMSAFVYGIELLPKPIGHGKWCSTHAWQKDAAVALCLVGIAVEMIASAARGGESDGRREVWWGYAIEIAGVALFAIYEILFSKYSSAAANAKDAGDGSSDGPGDDDADAESSAAYGEVQLHPGHGHESSSTGEKGTWATVAETLITVGMMGFANAIMLWPLVLAFHFAGIEHLAPVEADVVVRCFLNVAGGSLFTAAFLVGVALTSPLFMSVGAILIVPVGFIVAWVVGVQGDDGVWRKGSLEPWSIVGSVFITAGFCAMNAPKAWTDAVVRRVNAWWRKRQWHGRGGGAGLAEELVDEFVERGELGDGGGGGEWRGAVVPE